MLLVKCLKLTIEKVSAIFESQLIYCLLFALCITTSVHAQYVPLDTKQFKDSVEHVILGHASDSVKARANFILSYYWVNTDSVKSGQYLQQAKQLSRNNTFLQAISSYYEGNYYQRYRKKHAKSSYQRADSLLSKFENTEAYTYRFWCWYAYSKLVNEEDNDKERMNIIVNKALPMASRSKDSGLIGLCYGTMAIIFNNAVRLQKAEEYFLKSIYYLKKSPYKAILVEMYSRAGRNYMAYVNRVTEDPREMENVKKKLPLAKAVLDSARKLIANHTQSVAGIEYYKFRGKYARVLKRYEEAHRYLDSGMTIAKLNKIPYEVEMFYLHKYQVYSEQKQYKQAKTMILQLVNNPPAIFYRENRRIYYYELSLTYARLGDFKNAYEWIIKTNRLGDSLGATRYKSEIDALEVRYQTAEREKKIIQLESEKKQAILSDRNSQLVKWLLAVGCFLFLSIAIYSILLYRKNKRISQHQLSDVLQQQELKLSQALLKAQDEEQTRIARDLHDSLGSMLAGVKINLSGFKSEIVDTNDQRLNNTIQQLDSSVEELRRIAHNMMPTMLLRYGLEASLRELCESLISDSLVVDFQCLNVERTLPKNQQLFIYRIVQELLSNAIKHSNANHLMVQCSQEKSIFLISVEDNGKGFDADQVDLNASIGIANIKNRVAYLNGTITFLQKISPSGTIINIELHVTA
jgi:signal transduction histidine kinase